MESKKQIRRPIIRELSISSKNIRIGQETWVSLDELKKKNDTFDDVIKGLLKERTLAIGNKNIKAIKYHRRVLFGEVRYEDKTVGLEFEYNDVKNHKEDFVLDVKIKKVFYGKKSVNPSLFFGVNSDYKHFNKIYLNVYLKCVALTLIKEFGLHLRMRIDKDFENIVLWRKIFYENSLSEESFINDIEKPLGLSEEEKRTKEFTNKISKSPSASMGVRII